MNNSSADAEFQAGRLVGYWHFGLDPVNGTYNLPVLWWTTAIFNVHHITACTFKLPVHLGV